MKAMALMVLGTLMMAWALALQVPEQERRRTEIQADVAAMNFLSYRRAVLDYLNANPSASGTIPDASLTFQLGHVRNPAWSNTVSGGTLFVFSTVNVAHETADRIWEKTGHSLTAGRAVSGTLFSARGVSTGIVLPPAVPNNAVVIVGR